MKILLIYPVDREFMPPSMPPMGLAYIAATLLEQGHEVKVIDLNGNRKSGFSQLKTTLSTEHFDMVGISSIITQYKKVKELGKFIKSQLPDTPLVMGGPGPTSLPSLYLKNCSADVVCIGEGEETIKELARLLEKSMPFDSCLGISFRNTKAQQITNPLRRAISNVDSISLPAWQLFDDLPGYCENFLFRNGRKKGMSIFSTRGCPGQCIYCMCNFGRNLRMRSIGSIAKEIELILKNYSVEHIHFLDDTFITSAKRVADICNMFKTKFEQITWSANVRVDFVNPNILQCMAEANCISLAYGIESGSTDILNYMKKGFSPKQASNALSWTKDAGIHLRAYFIIGMPPETEETMQETVDFCKQNLVGGEFFFATPFPATELYSFARAKGIIKNEDVYMELVGEVRDFLVNLTTLSNEKLFTLKEEAEAQIKLCLSKHNLPIPESVRKDPRKTLAGLPEF